MEWLDLLNRLRDQQADEVTRRQIDALAGEIQSLQAVRDLQNIVLVAAIAAMLALVLILDHWRAQKIRRVTGKIADLYETISRADSTVVENRT